MKVKLIFNIPEEEDDLRDAINARKTAGMVFHLKHNLYRTLCKHSDKSDDYNTGVQDAINSLLEYLDDE